MKTRTVLDAPTPEELHSAIYDTVNLSIRDQLIGFIRERYTHFFEHGAYFGYPECCTVFFCLRFEAAQASGVAVLKKPAVLDGTGYIACPNCAAKGEAHCRTQIALNRKHPEPFAHEQEA